MALAGQIVTFFLLAVLPCAVLSAMMNYNYAVVKSGDGNFELRWTYNNSMLHFKMKCKGLGWCAVGFSADPRDGSGMKNYDIAAGGLMANNVPYLEDYWSTGQSTPEKDSSKDFTLVNASETNEYTMVEFYRNATTEDPMNDVQFKNDTEVWIMYGLHGTADESTLRLASKHTRRDRISKDIRYNLIMEAMNAGIQPSSTTTMSSSVPGSTTMETTTKSSARKAGSCAVVFAIMVLASCVLSF